MRSVALRVLLAAGWAAGSSAAPAATVPEPVEVQTYYCIVTLRAMPNLKVYYEPIDLPKADGYKQLSTLQADYDKAVRSDPSFKDEGMKWDRTECTDLFRHDLPTGAQTNGYGGTTVFVQTSGLLHSGTKVFIVD